MNDPMRIAMLGMVDGNGHPYSWSAIINGRYDADVMADCGYPVISEYLGAQPEGALGIPGVEVTHVWCDDRADAEKVAAAAYIPNTVSRAEDVIGSVDAVIIATDKGHEHVDRCRAFVDTGLPVFIDKPLTDNAEDLQIFRDWIACGKPILSSSCMRYAAEFRPWRESTEQLGDLRFVTITTPKSWERYGIHALEAVYPILGPGFVSARNVGCAGEDVVRYRHANGAQVVVTAIADMYGAFGALLLCGTEGHIAVSFKDSFTAFKLQLEVAAAFFKTGEQPFAFSETDELMRMVIAGIRSRDCTEEIDLISLEPIF
jgi:Oxidoreductase family, NAD-binding Rossmann fold